jgi:hypothetical protein
VKGSKILSRAAALMPTPVSATARLHLQELRAGGLKVASDHDLAALREFDGIADQVHQKLPHAQRVAQRFELARQRRAHDKIDAFRFGGPGEHGDAFFHQKIDVQRQALQHDFSRLRFRKIEQVVENLQQCLGRGTGIVCSWRACVTDNGRARR